MTIIEAIKSGKRFQRRRSCGGPWFTAKDGDLCIHVGNDGYFHPTVSDLLADDWEVEEKKVEITYNQLHAAYCKAAPGIVSYTGPRPVFVYPDFDKMAKEMGLID